MPCLPGSFEAPSKLMRDTFPLSKAEFLQRCLVRLRDKSRLRSLLKTGGFAGSPSRPFPFVFFSETVLALDCYRLSGDTGFVDLATENARQMLELEDGKLGLIDEFRQRPSSGWNCSYLYGFRRDPQSHSQYQERRLTNDITTSSIIGATLALYGLQAEQAGLLPLRFKSELIVTLSTVAEYYFSDLEEIDVGTRMKQPWQEKDEPLNHVAVYVIFLLLLDVLNPQEMLRKQALRLCRYIEKFFNFDANGCLFVPYRDDRQAKRVVGERYWKSTWTTLLISLCRRRDFYFTEADVDPLMRSVETNLIRQDGVYESLSARDGRLLTEDIVEYHRKRGQHLALYRFLNFTHLEALRPGIASKIWAAALSNPFLHEGVEKFDDPASTPLLESITSFFDPRGITLTFSHIDPIATSLT